MHITSIESSRRALPSWQTTNGRTITFDNRRGRGYQAWIPPPGYRAGRCLELKFSEVASPRPSLLHRLLQPGLLRRLSVETELATASLATVDSARTCPRTSPLRTMPLLTRASITLVTPPGNRPLVTASIGPDSVRTSLRTGAVRTKKKPATRAGGLTFTNLLGRRPHPQSASRRSPSRPRSSASSRPTRMRSAAI